jgi:hypothetical protein
MHGPEGDAGGGQPDPQSRAERHVSHAVYFGAAQTLILGMDPLIRYDAPRIVLKINYETLRIVIRTSAAGAQR